MNEDKENLSQNDTKSSQNIKKELEQIDKSKSDRLKKSEKPSSSIKKKRPFKVNKISK